MRRRKGCNNQQASVAKAIFKQPWIISLCHKQMLAELLIKEEGWGRGEEVKSDALLDLFKIISKCVMLHFYSSLNQCHWLEFIVLFFFLQNFKLSKSWKMKLWGVIWLWLNVASQPARFLQQPASTLRFYLNFLWRQVLYYIQTNIFLVGVISCKSWCSLKNCNFYFALLYFTYTTSS